MVKSKKGNKKKKRSVRRVGNKKFLLRLEKKRDKARKKMVNISCNIRTAKLKRMFTR